MFSQASAPKITGSWGTHGDVAPKLRRVQALEVHPIEADQPLLGVVEAQQELEQGRLARAGGPHQGDPLTGPDLEVQVAQHRRLRPRRVGEAEPLNGDMTADRPRQGEGPLGGADLGLGAQELHQPLARPGAPQQLPHDLAQVAHGAGHQHGIEQEGGELARRSAGRPGPRCPPTHSTRPMATEGDGHPDGGQEGPKPGPAHRGAEGRLHPLPVAGPVHRLVTKGLNGPDPVQHLVHEGAQVGDAILTLTRTGGAAGRR